jgi:hypothetical protein
MAVWPRRLKGLSCGTLGLEAMTIRIEGIGER